MFKKMKNIDSAFRYIRLFSIAFIAGCILISVFIAYKSYQIASQSQQKVFILANGKALEAYAADRKDNIPVEAKDHVKMFHHFFFTLDPDDKVIQTNITKALYLADNSAKQQYDNLKRMDISPISLQEISARKFRWTVSKLISMPIHFILNTRARRQSSVLHPSLQEV